MIKKLFSTVLISLLCGGILFSSSVIASWNLSYDIYFDNAEIKHRILRGINEFDGSTPIPPTDITTSCVSSYTCDYQDDDYRWCEYTLKSSPCNIEIRNINNFKKLKIYTPESNNNYMSGVDWNTITELEVLDLSNNNIKSVKSWAFFNMNKLQILDLQYNNISTIPNNFINCGIDPNINPTVNIKLDDNQINSITSNAFWLTNQFNRCHPISLRNNDLKIIPQSVKNLINKKIILNNNVNLWNWARNIDLTGNPINHVEITDPNPNYSINSCSQEFKRFGYSHNDQNRTYIWELIKNNTSIQSWHTTDTDNNKTNISWLKNGDYTFTVKLITWTYSEYIEDSKTYHVDLWDLLTLNTPNINNDYALFSWDGSYNCWISWYTISIDNWSEISVWDYEYYNTWNLADGNHTFTVKMYGTDNELIEEESVNFTINTTPSSDIKVTITAPKWTVTSSSTVFSREWQVSQPNSLWQALSEYIITWYDRKLYKWNNTDPISSWNVSTTDTTYNMNYNWLTNWKYTLGVVMNYCQQSWCYATIETYTYFEVQLSTGDAKITITKPTTGTLTSKIQEFIRSWDAWKNYTVSWYYYKLENTSTNQIVSQNTWSSLKSFTENNLTNWNYKLTVVMYIKDGANNVKTVTKSETYKVDLSESDVKLEITNPKTDWSKIDSKSATLTRSWTAWNNYAISGYYYKLENTDKNEIVIQNSGNVTSFSKSDFSNWNYKLTVTMYYKNWTSNIKEKTEIRTFTVSIKSSWWWSWGGGWGSSWKSHKTNEIQLSTDTPNPSKNQWVNLTIKTNDYTWKLTFSAKYRPDTSSSRTDISNNTSSNYYWNYSNIWEEWYYTMKSSDDGEKKLKNLVEFQKEWYYRIYVTDDQWTTSYTEFHIWNTDEERYIARSCKKYKLTYNNSLSVRTSPNLNKNEYFVNTDYFKRYIDSKNAQIQGCPTNDPRISNTYQDTTNRDDKYTAPNGKVYFINNKNWKYQSDELDYHQNYSIHFLK